MNKLNRVISLILCAAILIGVLPRGVRAENNDDGTCTLTNTVYVLVEEAEVTFSGQTHKIGILDIETDSNYLIVTSDTASAAYTTTPTLSVSNNALANIGVTIKDDGHWATRPYIENSTSNATVWIAHKVPLNPEANTGDVGRDQRYDYDWKFQAGSNYLNGGNDFGLTTSGNNAAQFTIRNHRISWWNSGSYARWNGNNWGVQGGGSVTNVPTNSTPIYFYKETEVTNTYSLSANGAQLYVGETLDLTTIARQLKVNGRNLNNNTLNGSYSYSIVPGSDCLTLNNTTLTGKDSGVAKIRITYSWGGNNWGQNRNEVYTDIDVIVGVPHYQVDIRDGNTSKNIIAMKNITSDTTKQLNAVVYYGNYFMPSPTVTWSSTNETVATVDQNGMVHFTGREGTTVILATYTYTNNEGEEITVIDQVTVTATTDSHIIPSDGTNDFPDYPDEGAVRLDKTGTAVGNFNQLGIVEVELSMTGVPYTTNNKLDVVLMLDESNSMTQDRLNATIAATKIFLYNLVYNEDGSFTGNNIYIGSFQGGNPDYTNQDRHKFRINNITNNGIDYQVVTTDAQYNAILSKIDSVLKKEGDNDAPWGTEYAKSLEFCYNLLNGSKAAGNSQYCVFMSDGIPNVYRGETSTTNSSTAMANMFTGTNYNTRDTDYQYEYYSSRMKENGVTVFSVGLGLKNKNSSLGNASAVQCEHVANILLNDISGPAGETAANRDTGSTISKMGEYFFSVTDQNANTQMKIVFDKIAKKIQEAAKDVKVEDQITEDYTMTFEPPSDYHKNSNSLKNQEFFIEIADYTLNPVYSGNEIVDYVRGDKTVLMKLYMGTNADKSYYAASDKNGTKFAAPLFEQKPIGSMYYWTTADITESSTYSGVSVTVDNKTYYFDSNGVSENETTNLTGWYNMSSGAYAYGTPTVLDSDYEDKKATVYQDLIIATPYFVYNAETRKLIWTLDKLSFDEVALRYFLYLDHACTLTDDEPAPGTYPTNVEATLAYTNFQNNKVQQWFPEPQMTWHGAQTSYVFYLVNEQGQPVNRAGRVVPISEAVYVTDVQTISVIWSGIEEQGSLGAELLADGIVPSVYELYDPTASYTIHAFANEEGMKQNNHFRIDGSTNTTYVYNTKSDSIKYNTAGIHAATETFLCKDYNVKVDGNDWKYTGDAVQYKDNNNAYVYGQDEDGRYYTLVYEESQTQVHEGFNFYDTTVAFAVLWTPSLGPDEVVIDYGLDVMIDITTNDMGVAVPVGLLAEAPRDAEGSLVTENTGVIYPFNPSSTTSRLNIMDNGQQVATATMEGTSIRFHLNRDTGMQLTQAYTFYYVSEVSYYENNELIKDYMYTHVRVIPATTMFYEDDFISFIDSPTSKWKSLGEFSSLVQDTDRPGPNRISAASDANNVYGYDSHYLNSTGFSLNSAKVVTVKAIDNPIYPGPGSTDNNGEQATEPEEQATEPEGQSTDPTEEATEPAEQPTVPEVVIPQVPGPKATFTFCGRGFDVIGRTDRQTTSILVTMTRNGVPYEFSGSFDLKKQQVTDSGSSEENDQEGSDQNDQRISINKIGGQNDQESSDQNDQEITISGQNPEKISVTSNTIFVDTYYEGAQIDGNTIAAIEQVPVVSVRGLDYGTYTVTVEVVINNDEEATYAHGETGKFYFDAVRIYEPIEQALSSDPIGDAYIQDKEWVPSFEEFRNEVLKVFGEDKKFSGVTFVDRQGNTHNKDEFGTYYDQFNRWGPNNELYLAPGESINLTVDKTFLKKFHIDNYDEVIMADMQLGMKLVGSKTTKATISYSVDGETKKSSTYNVSSASDLNFSIKDYYNGTLTIKNSGDGVLSLTTMKVTAVPKEPLNASNMQYYSSNSDAGVIGIPPEDLPVSPHSVISGFVLNIKQSFAAVIIAVANAMDSISKYLQDIAKSLFAGGG